MSAPIIVRLTKPVRDYPKGAEFGYASEAQARKVLGDDTFTVVRNQDNTAHEPPKRAEKDSK